ncbi:MAG: hypothetical protein NTW33_10795 [Methanoregula sp.]|jgi:hypothetical protein|nr:hypothetical protein [Methanoregula sp.]
MPFVVYEIDLVTGKIENPNPFSTEEEARKHAADMVEGWREGTDRVLINGNIYSVMTASGPLDFGALILREVA